MIGLLCSPRGFSLVLCDAVAAPTITVEAYIKWYSLFLVRPDGSVAPLHFHEVADDIEAHWDWGNQPSILSDHIIHPRAVALYAAKYELSIDPLAFELLTGRWVIEYGRL